MSLLADTRSHHQNHDGAFADSIDDPVTLSDGSDASVAKQLINQRLTLFLGFLGELPDPFEQFEPHPEILDFIPI